MFVLERGRRKIFQYLITGVLHVYEHEKKAPLLKPLLR